MAPEALHGLPPSDEPEIMVRTSKSPKWNITLKFDYFFDYWYEAVAYLEPRYH